MRRQSAHSRHGLRAILLPTLAIAVTLCGLHLEAPGSRAARAEATATTAIQTAFQQAYPTGRGVVARDEEQVEVVFTPKLLHRLDARTQVLVSVGRALSSDCHMCQGAFSVTYLIDGRVSGAPFVGFGSMGGLGVAPAVNLLTRLGQTPLLVVRNSFSNQGETEVWVDLIRLGPAPADVSAVAEGVPLAHDNAGSADDCQIRGRIVPKGRAGDFAVRYSGSFKGEVAYTLRDGRYVATPEPPALYERCPNA